MRFNLKSPCGFVEKIISCQSYIHNVCNYLEKLRESI